MTKDEKANVEITMLETMVEAYHTLRDVVKNETSISGDPWYHVMNVPLETLKYSLYDVMCAYGEDIDLSDMDEADAFYSVIDNLLWRHFEPQSVADIVDDYRANLDD